MRELASWPCGSLCHLSSLWSYAFRSMYQLLFLSKHEHISWSAIALSYRCFDFFFILSFFTSIQSYSAIRIQNFRRENYEFAKFIHLLRKLRRDMSAKIAAVNQTRSESESRDRDVNVSVIGVEHEPVLPPPSYEQAIIVQSEIERHRIQEQQRALEELVQEQNRLQRLRIEAQQIQQPETPTTSPQIVQRKYSFTFRNSIEISRIY